MTDHVGIVRNFAGLDAALKTVTDLKAEYASLPEAPFSQYSEETEDLLVCAEYVVRGAIGRKQNVGLHYNEDLAT
jgi:L-aspartate oxidase